MNPAPEQSAPVNIYRALYLCQQQLGWAGLPAAASAGGEEGSAATDGGRRAPQLRAACALLPFLFFPLALELTALLLFIV